MDEFLKAVNQFGLSIALMLTAIVALATWIVKKTVPKELYDSQIQSNKMKDDLKDISEGVDKLIYITELNVRTLETLGTTIATQNQVLSEISKHVEILRYTSGKHPEGKAK